MELFERIDAACERWNVLQHPFYKAWSDGTLKREKLAFYAGEYRHAVVALARATEAAAETAEPGVRAELRPHAIEEAAHVDLWDEFAGELGAETDRAPRAETERCAQAWTGGDTLADRLAVLYAIESAQPAISRTKLEGLESHYGMPAPSRATAYFSLHAKRDVEHAAQSRRLLAERASGAESDRLAELASSAIEANWRLLDGVEEQFAA